MILHKNDLFRYVEKDTHPVKLSIYIKIQITI